MGAERIGLRNRLVAHLDLKDASDLALAKELIGGADVLIEGFRPGVMERLGLGPHELMESNGGLVYLRISGWGQEGPYSQMAGHDINYIGLAGVLAAIGETRPIPPLNLIGDYAGGALYGVVGVLAALLSRQQTQRGDVVDAAMLDGAAALMGPIIDLMGSGMWTERRASNLLDGGAPFYRTYETSDGRFMAVGALEEPFYQAFLEGLGLDPSGLPARMDPTNWADLAERFAGAFVSRTQDEWCVTFDGTDACVTPVLSVTEAARHPHNTDRGLYTQIGDALVPTTAPRMGAGTERSRAEASISDTLVAAGLAAEEAHRLESEGLSYWA
jgi:alpha-methylacyl-CoA racemase